MNIAVYCGSKEGNNPTYAQAAKDLGQWIGQHHYGLCYGGATNGLMGIVANSTLEHGGQVIGVVPQSLHDRETWHEGLTDLIQVENLTQRKAIMAEKSDAYLALPGGPGTLEEISEMISWSRVNFHQKPCIIFNVDGFYDHLHAYLYLMVSDGFITHDDLKNVYFIQNVTELAEIL